LKLSDLLALCSEQQVISFHQLQIEYAKLSNIKKIGEATFSEVFNVTAGRARGAMKVLPFDGDLLVNGEKQQSLQDVYQEVNITRVLGQQLQQTLGVELNFVRLIE
jgi:hypothetical protein